MEFRYRDHLISTAAYLDSDIGDWSASAHIEFTENLKIHTVVLKPGDAFHSEIQAKTFINQQAKEWVNDRLRSTAAVKRNDKRISSDPGRSKQSMYWICRPCKNNRHDLCLKNSTSRGGTDVKIRCWCSLQPTHQLRLHDKSPAETVKPAELRVGISDRNKRNA